MSVVREYVEGMKAAIPIGLPHKVNNLNEFFAFQCGWIQKGVDRGELVIAAQSVAQEFQAHLNRKYFSDENFLLELMYIFLYGDDFEGIGRMFDEVMENEDILNGRVRQHRHSGPVPKLVEDHARPPEVEKARRYISWIQKSPSMHITYDWDMASVYCTLLGYASNWREEDETNGMKDFLEGFNDWFTHERATHPDIAWHKHYEFWHGHDSPSAHQQWVDDVSLFLSSNFVPSDRSGLGQ